jgi:hypothetical protein
MPSKKNSLALKIVTTLPGVRAAGKTEHIRNPTRKRLVGLGRNISNPSSAARNAAGCYPLVRKAHNLVSSPS